ncbi:MAG: nucleotidyltransferase [Clostridia bacterium]|nr:nucleotidyltransferase [Clostridia bacterium]
MTLVILAAGMGSRYGGMKQIDPINDDGNFIIDFSVYDAIKAGFDKVVFIIKEENFNDFKETIGNRINKHIKVEYAFQRISDVPDWFNVPDNRIKPWGTTQAMLSVADIVKEPFAVINSDDFYGFEAFEILAKHLKNLDIHYKPQFCMVGYRLKNTVTKHGAVNRGVCNVNDKNHLINIVETKEIVLVDDTKAEYPMGDQKLTIDLNSVVSMNCWGFTPELFPYLSQEFEKFLKNIENPLKDESYLPSVVDMMIKNKACDVTVYDTNACWLGVTYAEDKPAVVAGIKKLINEGVYPEHLWK